MVAIAAHSPVASWTAEARDLLDQARATAVSSEMGALDAAATTLLARIDEPGAGSETRQDGRVGVSASRPATATGISHEVHLSPFTGSAVIKGVF